VEKYLQEIRKILTRSSIRQRNTDKYLDLASLQGPPSPEELNSTALPGDALVTFQEMLMLEISKFSLDKIKVGINELLKHFMVSINPELEDTLAEHYMYRLRLIFKRCLMPDFPFPEEIWNYICDCLRTTGSFLLEEGYYTASREIIDSLAGMGRIAAVKGLPTANTQSSLRILENRAIDRGEKALASVAKNARFNLET